MDYVLPYKKEAVHNNLILGHHLSAILTYPVHTQGFQPGMFE